MVCLQKRLLINNVMNNTVKIICYGYRPNTAWTNRFIAYAKALVSLGKKVVFIFLIPDNNRAKLDLDIPNIECIYLWETDGPICRKIKLLSYIKNRYRIRRYIDNGDVCFFSDASGFYLNEARFSKKQVKIVFESTEHPEIFKRYFCKKIELAIFYRKLAKVDNLLVISKALKDHYIAKGFNSDQIHVVNMFVDSSRFMGLQKTDAQKYIAYCGSVGCKKDGVDILIKSFGQFLQVHPDYKLQIYGTGPVPEMTYLSELCHRLNIESSVIFTGKIPFNIMPQKLMNASILALSRPNNKQNQYGFPTKLGEYLATGNPVVVTSVGEIPNFIVDGENGYLAVPDSVDSFTQKLLQAATDLDSGKNVGVCGKLLVESAFSSNAQVKSVISIFRH